MAGECDVADLEGEGARRRGDGVLVHHPPRAAAPPSALVQVQRPPVPPHLLAAGETERLVRRAPLAHPRPRAAAAGAALAVLLVDPLEEVGLVVLRAAVAREHLPWRHGGARALVLNDDARDRRQLAARARKEVERDELLCFGAELDARRKAEGKRRHLGEADPGASACRSRSGPSTAFPRFIYRTARGGSPFRVGRVVTAFRVGYELLLPSQCSFPPQSALDPRRPARFTFIDEDEIAWLDIHICGMTVKLLETAKVNAVLQHVDVCNCYVRVSL